MQKTVYTVPSEADINALGDIVPSERMLLPEARKFKKYSHDQVADERCAHMPDVVVFPETTEEVCARAGMRSPHGRNRCVSAGGGGVGMVS